MDFSGWLTSKNIDAEAFRMGSPAEFAVWEEEFNQLSPASFQAQKLFLINKVRRTYQLPPEVSAKAKPPKAALRPAKPTPTAERSAKPDEEVRPEAKPETVVAKPKFRPKVKAKAGPEAEGNDETSRPKPVFRPKIKPKAEAKGSSEESPDAPKPKPKFRPKIKPKVPDNKEATTDEAKPKRPVIKPKIKK
jgi:hypothetical protein